ncbi:hypothetical protein JL722_78 [Aureococcus anophagefferens]|nr:hypothetical protein JL722_78 [Aureococcus anophagefferens]
MGSAMLWPLVVATAYAQPTLLVACCAGSGTTSLHRLLVSHGFDDGGRKEHQWYRFWRGRVAELQELCAVGNCASFAPAQQPPGFLARGRAALAALPGGGGVGLVDRRGVASRPGGLGGGACGPSAACDASELFQSTATGTSTTTPAAGPRPARASTRIR